MTDTIRVLIADDHAVVRQGLRLFLDVLPDVEVVGEAENGAVAVERAREVREEQGYFGRAVFVAARIAEAAAGGEVLVSEVTRQLAGDGKLEFRPRGPFELKGLKGPHELHEVVWRP